MATTEPQKWTATLGSTADVNALPTTTPSGSGRASTSGLFPPVTQLPLDQGGIAPERGDFNALFKYLGEYLFYLMQGGMFSYSTDYDYTAGNLVMHEGSLYLCIAANGPGSAIKYPTDADYWRQLALTSQLPIVNNGTLTIQKNGANVATFSANQAGNTTANISVPTVNNGTLTIQQDGVTVGTFTANQSGNTTVNVTGGGTLSGTILGGYVVPSSAGAAGTYKGIVGTEYDVAELFQRTQGGFTSPNNVFHAYPPGTKFECIRESTVIKRDGNVRSVANGAFKLKSLGTGGVA